MQIDLYDGTLEFQVRRGNQTLAWVTDVVTLKLAAEELEGSHALVGSNGYLMPTSEFLTALAQRYVQLGCPECTPAMAKQIWMVTAKKFAQLATHLQGELSKE